MPRRESPITLDTKVRNALLERHKDEHNAGHLYMRDIQDSLSTFALQRQRSAARTRKG